MNRIFRLLCLAILLVTGSHSAEAQCVASFTAVQTPAGNSLLNVVLTNNSSYGTPFTGQTKSIYINYGDGTKNFYFGTAIPAHTYAPGSYSVGLRIYSRDTTTHSLVCTDTATVSLTVAYPACGTVLSVTGSGGTFSFAVANPAGSTGITYAWNFGDGTTGTGSSPSHTYTSYGTYTATCTSTVGSCTYVNTITVTALIAPAPLNCSTLQASFTTYVPSGSSALYVTNTSSNYGFPYGSQYKVYFGDGTSDVGNLYAGGSAYHTYSATGTYSVKLVMEWRDSISHTKLCMDSATSSITISAVSTSFVVGDILYDSSTYGALPFKVWLIQFDPVTNLLSAIDSQIIAVGNWGGRLGPNYKFSSVMPGNYLVKAAVYSGPTSGTGILPTYCDSSALWSLARTINVNNTQLYNIGQITMRTGTLTAGPGFVGGNVSMGANKGASGGVPGMTILLRNAVGVALQMTSTDASGNFSFSKLPIGSYTVYPEKYGYATTYASVSISNGHTQANGVDFHQDDVKMNIKPLPAAVTSITNTPASWSLYPNPAHNLLSLSWRFAGSGSACIVISDITGRAILSQSLQGAQGQQEINLEQLQPGMYIVRGSGALMGQVAQLSIR